MPERVELARPFAVVGIMGGEMHVRAVNRDQLGAEYLRDCGGWDGAIVVRLTAERVEEPVPEAKSGWEWRVSRDADASPVLYLNRGGHWEAHVHFRCGALSPWRPYVPPCDHAHVAALLRREGVE